MLPRLLMLATVAAIPFSEVLAAKLANPPNDSLTYAEQVDCQAALAGFEYGVGILQAAARAFSAVNETRARTVLRESLHHTYPLCYEISTENPPRRYIAPRLLAADMDSSDGQLIKQQEVQSTLTLYVAPSGNDASSGSDPDSPVKSLQQALTNARTWRRQQGNGFDLSVTILLREGTYFLARTVVLQPGDSNTVIQSYPGELATLSGGVPLGELEWAEVANGIRGVLSAALPPHVAAAIAGSTTMFAGRQRLTRARFPNGNSETDVCLSKIDGGNAGCPGYLPPPYALGHLPSCLLVNSSVVAEPNRLPACCTPSTSKWCPKPGEANWHAQTWSPPQNLRNQGFGHVVTSMGNCPYAHAPGGFKYNGTDARDHWTKRSWADPSTGVVHMFHGNGNRWGGWNFRIGNVSSAEDDVVVNFSEGGWQEGRGNGQANSFFVENIREELDARGEYFLDHQAARIYLLPRPGDNVSQLVAPVLEELMQLNGTIDAQVQNVTIRGLQFTHTSTVFMKQYEYPLGSDWGIRRTAAVSFHNTHNSVIEDCLFERVGGNGIMIAENSSDCLLTRNEIAYPGESGIVLLGKANQSPVATAAPDHNEISLNHIHHVGIWGKQTSCIVQAVSSRTKITHNLCYAGPRAGINFCGAPLLSGFPCGQSV